MDSKKIIENKDNKGNKKPFKKSSKSSIGRPIRKILLDPKKGSLIAITGGIASGKSTVLACFEKLGFEVFNSDRAIHEMMKKDGAAFARVAKLCPEAITDEGIDRKVLSQKVFTNPEKLKELESILHPLVRKAQVDLMVKTKNSSGKSIVFEVPLLFENKREKSYDYVVVCSAPKEKQKERAMARNNMTEEKFNAIIEKQVSDSVRLKGAHIVIKTGRTIEDTFKQVKAVIFDANNKRINSGHRNNRPKPKKR